MKMLNRTFSKSTNVYCIPLQPRACSENLGGRIDNFGKNILFVGFEHLIA